MSTPTPITDHASLHTDAFDSPAKAREFARRLELDRSALMEALFDCMGWTHRAIDLEVSGSMQIAQKGAIERAEAALATARANFPEP